MPGGRGGERWPRLSPDNSQLAVVLGDGPGGAPADIWIYDLNRPTREKFTTSDATEDAYPVWTPDGSRIVYLTTMLGKGNEGDLYWQPLNRSAAAESLIKSEPRTVATSWRADGQVLAFYEVEGQNQRDIWMMSVHNKTATPFIATPADELAATFSPNGRWVAYVSDETGERQVYVQPYPGPGPRIPISSDGGEGPVWSRDGRELFYFRPDQIRQNGQMMGVDIEMEPTLRPGVPRVLFDGPYLSQNNGNANYDVFRDGKRFPDAPTIEPIGSIGANTAYRRVQLVRGTETARADELTEPEQRGVNRSRIKRLLEQRKRYTGAIARSPTGVDVYHSSLT
jgi:Tol biopolymer transport system component